MKEPQAEQVERLGDSVLLHINRQHRFGIDAFLLAHFAGDPKALRVVDLCGGCGIVAALLFREAAHAPALAVSVEIDPEGSALLTRSAEDSHLTGRLVPVCGDLKAVQSPLLPKGAFDLVVCNPPYKAAGSGIESRESAARRARHEIDCTLQDVCARAGSLLRFRGRFLLCIRPERLADAIAAMRRADLEPKRLQMVQKHPDTAPWLCLIEGRRGCKPFLSVAAPLIVYQADGDYTPILKEIYRINAKGQ